MANSSTGKSELSRNKFGEISDSIPENLRITHWDQLASFETLDTRFTFARRYPYSSQLGREERSGFDSTRMRNGFSPERVLLAASSFAPTVG